MASQMSVSWGDGTTDKIYVTPGNGSGDSTLQITSDSNNTSSSRTKVIHVQIDSGNQEIIRNVTVTQEAGGPQTYTMRLIPSSYGRSNNSYVTVTNPDNMYENTDDSSDVCSIRGRNNSSNTYYCYIRGFNISDVPSNATVTSFKVKIKCYRNSYLRQDGSTYYLHLCNNTSAIQNTYMSEAVTTSSDGAVYEIPTGSLTWANIKQYGTNFGIRVPLRSTSSSRPYLYVYGAEIEVTYTL